MPRALRRLMLHALLAGVIALLGVLLLYPIALTTRGAFEVVRPDGTRSLTLEHLALALADPRTRSAMLSSLQIAVCTTGVALLIGVPLASASARTTFPGKSLFNALALVPLILPPFVGAIGVRAIMGRQGALNALLGTEWDFLGEARLWGVVAVQSLSLYPIVYLNATAALANLDPALDEAAQALGASSRRRFFGITLPLIRPGLFAGATIVFIWSFTELGTPLIFEYYDVLPVQIFSGLKEVESSPRPYALALILLATSLGMYAIGRRVLGGRAYPMYAKASRAAMTRPLPLARGLMVSCGFALVIGLALLPHLGVVLTSLATPGSWYRSVLPAEFTGRHFAQALGAPDSFNAILNSIGYSSAAMVINLGLGLLIAYLLTRTRLRGRAILDLLSMLPLAVPGLVLAFGFVAATLNWPFERGDPLHGVVSVIGAEPRPILLLVFAYAIRRLPYIVRSTVAGLEQTPVELEEAAQNLGASRMLAVRRIVVPLIAANMIAGALLVFSFSMLEVSDSLILAQQTDDYPITKAILAFMERIGDGPSIASAMGVWGMALLTLTLVGASLLMGKRLGSIFR